MFILWTTMAVARAAVLAAGLDVEVDAFPGGAILTWPDRGHGVLGFADATTAVIYEGGRRSIVEVPP